MFPIKFYKFSQLISHISTLNIERKGNILKNNKFDNSTMKHEIPKVVLPLNVNCMNISFQMLFFIFLCAHSTENTQLGHNEYRVLQFFKNFVFLSKI